jgi:hypothetical protein
MKEQRLDCPYDFTSRCTMGRCDCKPKQETLEEPDYEKIKQALIKFRKTPITFVPDKRMYSEEEVINFLQEMNDWPTTFEGKIDIREWFEQFKKK